jgi:ubiquinone/menaquinone biosynthesis C-methylase UbiE
MENHTQKSSYHYRLIKDTLNYAAVKDQKVLIVGCGRGLECELLRKAGVLSVVGVDPSFNIGSDYQHETIQFFNAHGEDLPFEDESFNLVASYATLEHVFNPKKVIEEMIRVTASRGIIYIHAAPLWNSPFGHHKNDCFPDEPWIHIRYNSLEKMKQYLGTRYESIINGNSLEEHIKYIFSPKFFNHYSVAQFKKVVSHILNGPVSVRAMEFHLAYAFEKLLTKTMRTELATYSEEELFTEWLKLVFRKI